MASASDGLVRGAAAEVLRMKARGDARPTASEDQHQVEIEKNLQSWRKKPLLQEIYKGCYERIVRHIDGYLAGRLVELGSGIGNLKIHLPHAICADLFPHQLLDVVDD